MASYPNNKMLLCACTCLILVLSLHTMVTPVSAAPAMWGDDSSVSERQTETAVRSRHYVDLLEDLLRRLQNARAKRTRADGGFFSRHDAMSDYLNAAIASDLASSMYGPGKR